MQQTAPPSDILQDLNEHGMTMNPHKSPSGKSWRRITGTRSASLQMCRYRYALLNVCLHMYRYRYQSPGYTLQNVHTTDNQSPKCRLHTCACERW